MAAVRGRLVEGGRIIVPAAYRRAMGLTKGDTVLMELRGEELLVRPAKSALRRVQERLRPYASATESIVDELIADRRAEAARD